MGNIFLGAKLKELRNKNGYTQQQVAEYLGVKNKSTVASWESGKSEPDAHSLITLCNLFKVPSIKEVAIALGFGNTSFETDNLIDKKNSPAPAEAETRETDSQLDRLLKNYESLNEEGKEKLVSYSEDLVSGGRYIKNNQSAICEEA